MPVNSRHPLYSNKLARWNKQRHAFDGEDAVKLHASLYLDRPEGFLDKHYERYVRRAKWYGATKRTVGALTGAIMQKPPVLSASARFLRTSQDITLSGIDLEDFALSILADMNLIGRYGVLLDYSDEQKRPYWSGFPPEKILNWRTERIDGEDRLTLIVLQEHHEDFSSDFYDLTFKDRVRVGFLNSDGVYEVQIHEQPDGSANAFSMIESFIPERRKKPLPFIPFQFFGSTDLTPDISDGPMDDLCDVNYSYFRHSADYEHGLYLTGIPTPVVTGHENRDEVLAIGALTAWILPNPEAKAYFLEYQGMGLETLERAMETDKQEMATLGARLLEQMPGVQETLGAVQLRHAGDTGSLRTIANLVSQGMTRVIQVDHWWNGDTEEPLDEKYSIELNTDFSSMTMSAQDLLALFTVFQGGGFSQETFLYNLQQGERLPPDVSIEDEIRRIEITQPTRLPFGDDENEGVTDAA